MKSTGKESSLHIPALTVWNGFNEHSEVKFISGSVTSDRSLVPQIRVGHLFSSPAGAWLDNVHQGHSQQSYGGHLCAYHGFHPFRLLE